MRTIIHIGGNKTASTLLQRRLFSKHKSLEYLGEDCRDYSNLKQLLDSLVSDDDSFFDHAATMALFSDRFRSREGLAACVYSNEDIMTSPLPSVCAARLRSIAPEASIVMVIRNQLTTWPSWYANHGAYLKNVPRRYWKRHVALDEWLDYCFNFPKVSPVEAMNYERFFNIFCAHYPPERIHVLLYEELIASPSAYYERWAQLLGIPGQDIQDSVASHVERGRSSARRVVFDAWTSKLAAVPGMYSAMTNVLPRWNALRTWLDSGRPANIKLPELWSRRIEGYYRQSNSNLAKMTGLDLARHGYPV